MTERRNPWMDFDWPGVLATPPHHLSIEDVRRWIALATQMQNAHEQGAESGGISEQQPHRFAPTFDNWMGAYATAVATDWQQVAVQRPDVIPGAHTVWHEHSFAADIAGVTTAVDPAGEFVVANCTQITKGCIYDVNTSGTLTPVEETWYKQYDDFRPGTPFVVLGSADDRNDGYYRVRSRRMDGSTLYIAVDGNQYQPRQLVDAGAGGTMTCDFGGDWWTLRGAQGNCLATYMNGGETNPFFAGLPDAVYIGGARDRWWTSKDLYHRYADHIRGPKDGRPPSGGPHAVDFNADWVRGVNTNLYHCYDHNAHRYVIGARLDLNVQTEDAEQWIAVIPSHNYLPYQCDPKEQQPPYYFRDTIRAHWKYGNKVPLRVIQITNPAGLGAIQSTIESGYHTASYTYVGTSSDRQYGTVHTRDAGGSLSGVITERGTEPVAEDGPKQFERDKNYKYDAALQNMVELACEESGWCWPVDDVYKLNWLTLYRNNVLSVTFEYYLYGTETGSKTFAQAYTDHGLDAYNPMYEYQQREYAFFNDELWGENSSAFEKILQLLGPYYYDWYYDDQYPYMSKRVLDERWLYRNQHGQAFWDAVLPGTYNGVYCTTPDEFIDAHWPKPHGVWRRTWKRTLGYVREGQMRSGYLDPPDVHQYNAYSQYPFSDPAEPVYLFGHIRMSAPSGAQYAGNDLAADHGPAFVVNDTGVWRNKVIRILNDCYDVLGKLKFKHLDVSMEVLFEGADFEQVDYNTYNSREALLDAYKSNYEASFNHNIEEWTPASDPGPLGWEIGHNLNFTANEQRDQWSSQAESGGYSEFAIKITTPLIYDSDAVSFLIQLQFKKYWSDYAYYSPTIFLMPDGNIVEPGDTYEFYYLLVQATSDTEQYLRLKIIGPFDNWVLVYNEPWGEQWQTFTLTRWRLSSSALRFLAVFNWTRYPDAIWRRLYERSDYALIDHFGPDRNPPVVTNEFAEPPRLIDANFPAHVDGKGLPWPYDATVADYQAAYRIQAEAMLMEDLEGNGVSYLFEFDHGTHSESASQNNKTQSSRHYDELLKTAYGESGGPGTRPMAQNAADQQIDQWQATVNSKDNYSGRIPTEDDNVGEPSPPSNIIIDLPMLPVEARFVPPDPLPSNPVLITYHYSESVSQTYLVMCLDHVLPGQGETSVVYRVQHEDVGQWSSPITAPGTVLAEWTVGEEYDALPPAWRAKRVFTIHLGDHPEYNIDGPWRVRYHAPTLNKSGLISITETATSHSIYLY